MSDSGTNRGCPRSGHFAPETGRLTALDALKTFNQPASYVPGAADYIQRWNLAYDKLGNLSARTNTFHNVAETFGYDNLNRLTSVSRTGGTTTFEYDISGYGNLTRRDGITGTLQYNESNAGICAAIDGGAVNPGPHAMTSAGGVTYCYDANGNQIGTVGGDNRRIAYTAADQVRDVAETRNPTLNERSLFYYGADRQRYKRVDLSSGVNTTILYVGDVEVIFRPGAGAEFKRYIHGVLVATWTLAGGGGRDYLFTDHQGSSDVISDRFGNAGITVTADGVTETIGQRMAYDPFGQRRALGTGDLFSKDQARAHDTRITTKGYTAHEHVDRIGLIHMNGRMYDPFVGRFIQADPFVQDPLNTQSLNRYAYVMNNPMSATDPSGYFSLKDAWRPLLAIAITIYTGGAALGHWSLFGVKVTTAAGAWATAIGGGAAAGAVQSGNLKGAVQGALSAAVFFAIGGSGWSDPAQWGARAVTSGVLEEINGGNFGHGFLRAGLTEAIGGRIDTGNFVGDGIAHAILGGTMSAATGGKFANGAVTAAFSYAFSSVARSVMSNDTDATGVNVTDPRVGRAAGAAANEALGDALTTTHPTLDAAATAWSDAVQPVAGRFDTEIASKFFSVRGGFRIGRAYSDGVICSRSVQCGVSTSLAPDVRSGMLAGYIHTHPSNAGFSGNDLAMAYRFYTQTGIHQSAYVSLPNRQVFAWSTESWASTRPGLGSWQDYAQFSRQVR
jgi:RHS repeat-associated protein